MSPIVLNYGNNQNPDSLSPDAYIRVINPNNSLRRISINAIVDSGAMMTCIPETIIRKLGSLNYNSVNTRDFNNNLVTQYTYYINLEFESELFPNLEVIATSKKYALIGRDILNRKKVTLDAPQEIWIYNCQGNCLLDYEEKES